MEEAARERLEREVRTHCGRDDYRSGASAALRGYGPEIFGFLVAVHRSDVDASDAFSAFSEALWRSLPSFAWDSSLRTWLYGVARNVSRTLKRDAGRRERRRAGGDSVLEGLMQAVRTDTLTYLRTETRTRLEALRDALPEEDRILLVLRVNRGLSWSELARVMVAEGQGNESPTEATLSREAARLRKRYQLAKDRLRAMARRSGLCD